MNACFSDPGPQTRVLGKQHGKAAKEKPFAVSVLTAVMGIL
jgi:hypothetical protein